MANDPVLADYVYRLAALPECPAFLLYNASESELIRVSRYSYSAVSLWLRHLVLAEKLAKEAFLTDAKYYQPLGEIAAAELKLAIGLHPRTANPLICSFDAPAELWFYLKWVQSQWSLRPDLLAGKSNTVVGKRQSTNAAIKQFNVFADLRFPYRKDVANDEPHRLIEIFHGEAQKLAKADCNFQIDYWNPYVRTVKRCINKVRKCEALQNVFLLPEGELYWTGKDKKLPSAKNGRKMRNSKTKTL